MAPYCAVHARFMLGCRAHAPAMPRAGVSSSPALMAPQRRRGDLGLAMIQSLQVPRLAGKRSLIHGRAG